MVRFDGIDTESGKHRPRQLGTFTSRRSAQRAASAFTESGDVGATTRPSAPAHHHRLTPATTQSPERHH